MRGRANRRKRCLGIVNSFLVLHLPDWNRSLTKRFHAETQGPQNMKGPEGRSSPRTLCLCVKSLPFNTLGGEPFFETLSAPREHTQRTQRACERTGRGTLKRSFYGLRCRACDQTMKKEEIGRWSLVIGHWSLKRGVRQAAVSNLRLLSKLPPNDH